MFSLQLVSCLRACVALPTEPADDTSDLSKFGGILFGNRDIHYWLLRHLDL